MPEPQPKFYRSIALVRARTHEIQHGHLQFQAGCLSGEISGDFVACQPLHVGTGQLVPPASVRLDSDVPLVKSFYQIGGRLTVPGSSLKGAVRSLVEMITYAAVSKTKARLSAGYKEEMFKRRRYDGDGQANQKADDAGEMFGVMGYLGQVYFQDAPLLEGKTSLLMTPAQYPPSGEIARRYYPHALVNEAQPTWPLQVVESDSRFGLSLQFINLTPAQLGVLMLALGQGDPPICLKLGAAKNSGLGAVRFTSLAGVVWQIADLYRAYDSQPAAQPLPVAGCLAAAASVLRADGALADLQRDLGCAHVD